MGLCKIYSNTCNDFFHSVSYCNLTQGYDPNTTQIILSISSFLTPSFMFSMGFTMNYTCKHSPDDYIQRGIKILLVGLLINVLYFLSDFEQDWDYTILLSLYYVMTYYNWQDTPLLQ